MCKCTPGDRSRWLVNDPLQSKSQNTNFSLMDPRTGFHFRSDHFSRAKTAGRVPESDVNQHVIEHYVRSGGQEAQDCEGSNSELDRIFELDS